MLRRAVTFSIVVLFFALGAAQSDAGTLSLRPAATASKQGFNRIEGTVWDPSRKPVSDVYVELANSMEGGLSRARTNGSGRFTFQGLSTGRFRLKVITAGTNYLEETQDVEILGTGVPNSRDTQYVDFYLKYDPRKVSLGSGGPAEAIFVQDVPKEAEKLYKKAQNESKPDVMLGLLEDAIKVYPDYFAALSMAGKTYVDKGEYVKGAAYLIRAVDLNPRSYSSYGSLAYAAYKLKKFPEAIKAARAAVTLESKAVGSRVLLARLLRLDGSLTEAEQILRDTLKFAKDTPNVHYELALVLNREGKNAEAADELVAYSKLITDENEKKQVEELIAKLRSAEKK